jgi:hypothetical protein
MYADQTAGVKLPEQLERAGYRSGDNLVDDPVLKGALGSARPVTTSQDDGDPGRDFDKFTTFMRDALLPPK